MNNTFWAIIYSGPLWVTLLVLFIVSLIFRALFRKRLASQVGNDEFLPRVKEMLSGKMTKKNMVEVRSKLLQEGVEPKRVSRLIAASFSTNTPKFSIIIIVLVVILSIVNIIRGYTPSSTYPMIVTPVGPIVYTNSNYGYQITLPKDWVGIRKSQASDTMYFGNKNPSSSPIGIEIESGTTTKDISSSTVQQQIVQASYGRFAADSKNESISENLSAQPPYIEYTATTSTSVIAHARWYYYFGDGRIYAVLVASPDDIWTTALSETTQVLSTFKIVGN